MGLFKKYGIYHSTNLNRQELLLKDYGGSPLVVDMNKITKLNKDYRLALWTGDNLQVTLMHIEPGESIELELHPDIDQFIRVEYGEGYVEMGKEKDALDFKQKIYKDYAVMVPAGRWHKLTNTGHEPLKVYSIYAPPEHPYGTVHETKEDSDEAESHENK